MAAAPDPADCFERARAGDEAAASELFERYYDRVLVIVRRRLGNALRRHHESGDLVQEAMLQAVRDLERFEYRDEPAFVAWLAGIVENRIRDLAKYHGAQKRDAAREKRAGSIESSSAGDPLERIAGALSGGSPASVAADNEQRDAIERALGALEPQRRRVIELRGSGCSWAEAAAELGLASEGAARMFHSRAMVQLVRAVERVQRGDAG